MSETPSTDSKADPTPATIPVPEPAAPKPEDQLAAAKQEAAASYDRYTRAVADLENFRKRTLREHCLEPNQGQT